MPESIEVSVVLPTGPRQVYEAWLNSDAHAAFTGRAFTAWDGYIQGKNLELEPFTRILQSWRTTDFPAASPDSQLEVLLEAEGNGTRLTLRHTNIPDGQGDSYQQGWVDYYFEPMKTYFGTRSNP